MRDYLAGFQLLVLLAIVVFLAWIAHKLFGKGILAGAGWLKEETIVGAPSRAIDAGISAATGREETLGGWLADVLNSNARKVNEIYRAPIPAPLPPYSINPRDRT